jgi:hypothetical protein
MLINYTDDNVLVILSSITNYLWMGITVFLIAIANFVVVLNAPEVNEVLLCVMHF